MALGGVPGALRSPRGVGHKNLKTHTFCGALLSGRNPLRLARFVHSGRASWQPFRWATGAGCVQKGAAVEEAEDSRTHVAAATTPSERIEGYAGEGGKGGFDGAKAYGAMQKGGGKKVCQANKYCVDGMDDLPKHAWPL